MLRDHSHEVFILTVGTNVLLQSNYLSYVKHKNSHKSKFSAEDHTLNVIFVDRPLYTWLKILSTIVFDSNERPV